MLDYWLSIFGLKIVLIGYFWEIDAGDVDCVGQIRSSGAVRAITAIDMIKSSR